MKYKMSEMTWQEFAMVKDKTVLFLPIGSTEQHCFHMPVSVDSIISTRLAELTAQQVGGIVAPTINYGYKSAPFSGGGPLFPGTIDLNGTTLQNLVYDVLTEFIRDGVRKIFIVNGHYENEAFTLEAVDLVSRLYPEVKIVHADWWDQFPDAVMDRIFDQVPFPGWGFEHAGITETSMMLYLAPELVDMSTLVEQDKKELLPYAVYPIRKDMVPESGLLATAFSSTPEKGKLMIDTIVDAFVHIIREELA